MERSNSKLWERIKKEILKGSRGGLPNQWSARKAQLAVKIYKDKGGKYNKRKSSKNSLHQWTIQDWRTKSGLPSLLTGERYLPAKAIKNLSSSEYSRTTRKKRQGLLKGEQFTKQPRSIMRKTRRYRRF
jgi:hypothetical protein